MFGTRTPHCNRGMESCICKVHYITKSCYLKRSMLLSTYSQRKWVWTQVYPPFETLNLKLAGLLAGSLFLFLGIFIFGTIRRNRKQKLLLLFLTLSIVLQIDYILFYKELPDLFVNIWMGLPTVFGPLTLLYVQSLIRRREILNRRNSSTIFLFCSSLFWPLYLL